MRAARSARSARTNVGILGQGARLPRALELRGQLARARHHVGHRHLAALDRDQRGAHLVRDPDGRRIAAQPADREIEQADQVVGVLGAQVARELELGLGGLAERGPVVGCDQTLVVERAVELLDVLLRARERVPFDGAWMRAVSASVAKERSWSMQGRIARVTPGATPRCPIATWRVGSPTAADETLRSSARPEHRSPATDLVTRAHGAGLFVRDQAGFPASPGQHPVEIAQSTASEPSRGPPAVRTCL
jgi:hypothetical protein